ncbi:MAG: RadC family protein, partial [Gemmatimonadota bacterium]
MNGNARLTEAAHTALQPYLNGADYVAEPRSGYATPKRRGRGSGVQKGTVRGSGAAPECSTRDLAPAEAPQHRLRRLGAEALSTAELLAVVMGNGVHDRSALDIGHDLLHRAGQSLRFMAAQPIAALKAARGVGMGRALAIHAALELGRRRSLELREPGAPIRAAQDVYALFSAKLEDLPVEEFHIAVLNSQGRLERDVLVTRGILNSSLVHPREVFREAIAERAAGIILVHNHPSGDPAPSAEDRNVTRQLQAAGQLLDIPVYDH